MTKKVKLDSLEEITNKEPKTNVFFYLAFSCFVILLFYPPYFRGLFFQGEQQWALLIAGCLFALTWFWKFANREITFLKKPLDFFALLLVGAYILSSFGAANSRLAVAEIVKYAIYFFIFWLSSQLVRRDYDVRILLHSIYISGVGVALAGIMCATNLIYIKDGFVDGRIFSTMQYPNALAAYLVSLVFIGLFLCAKGNKISRYLYGVGNYILLLIYIATGSRGGVLLFPVAALIFFLGLPKKYRLSIVGHFITVGIAAIVGSHKLSAYLMEGNHIGAWQWFFLGVLVVLVGQVLQYINNKAGKREVAIILMTMLLIVIIGGLIKYSDTESVAKILPSKIVNRIDKISLKEGNVQERFIFWKDAMEIVKEHPVFGLGGGAFEETYRRYQSYFYSSTQVHNHYVQMWAEIGTFGILIFLGLWISYFHTVWKLWWKQENHETKFLVWSMFSTAMMLGMHAFLDFDLSLSAITIVLFAMFGLTRGIERYSNSEYKVLDAKNFGKVKMIYQSAVVGVTLVIMIFISMLHMGRAEARNAAIDFKNQDLELAKAHFEKAIKLDPFNVDYRADLAKVYMNIGDKDKAIDVIESAVDKAPYNSQILGDAANIYFSNKNFDKVVEYSELAVEKFPFNIYLWERLSYWYFVAGLQAFQIGDDNLAFDLMQNATEVPGKVEAKMSEMTEFHKKRWKKHILPLMTITPHIRLYNGIGSYFVHDWVTAEKNMKILLINVNDEKLKGEAAMWLSIMYEKQGKNVEAEKLNGIASDKVENFERTRRALMKLPVKR